MAKMDEERGDVSGGPGSLAELRATHGRALHQAVARIREVLPSLPGVRRVSLFGSYVRGSADLFTDLDVLVVRETDEPFVARHRSLYRALALPVDLDLICYTPEEFEAMRDRPFLREILGQEVVLYEAAAR
jgi:predicted nucleotidyltransferase